MTPIPISAFLVLVTATGLAGALSRRAAAADSRPLLTPRETDVLLRLIDGDWVLDRLAP